MSKDIPILSLELSQQVSAAVAASANELQLQTAVEHLLFNVCCTLKISWVQYSINVPLAGSASMNRRFADSVHGAVIIEYKKPESFKGRNNSATLSQAKQQCHDYAIRLQLEEGRPLNDYVLICWDGAHIAFGRVVLGEPQWDNLTAFDAQQAQQLITLLETNGRPLVHPLLLTQLVGPNSPCGAALMPALFNSLVSATGDNAPTTRTKLLYKEWSRLFGQVLGVQSDSLQSMLEVQSNAHGVRYEQHIGQYIFALSTQIAMVSKLVASLSLPNPTIDVGDHAIDLRSRMSALENGTIFSSAGVVNMLSGDFFAWYLDEEPWEQCEEAIGEVLSQLAPLDFDVKKKSVESVRDLFKGMYENFIPRAMRHSLGEFYTPDWLAAHTLDVIDWKPQAQLLDPTCGTGTFLLEAMKRRLALVRSGSSQSVSAQKLLDGIYGMDLNPLAVLATRASLVVFLSPYLSPERPISLPVWLADAINSAQPVGNNFEHDLLTETGLVKFRVPRSLVSRQDFYAIFEELRDLISAGLDTETVVKALWTKFVQGTMSDEDMQSFEETVAALVELHRKQWDGIWCPILADRFLAGALPKVSHIVGNPPWVKWGNLPTEYADFIKQRCRSNGVFSDDKWYGGIQSDISTVITFECLAKWLKPRGTLAFLITGSVITTRSSQGFRRMQYRAGSQASFVKVEDFNAIRPFEGVSNHPILIVLSNGKRGQFPVPYRVWQSPNRGRKLPRTFESSTSFRDAVEYIDLVGLPLPGVDGGPWIRGTVEQLETWSNIVRRVAEPTYEAHKGVCTDRNGIFFLQIIGKPRPGICLVGNNPDLGRVPDLLRLQRVRIESDHLYPLLRGAGVGPFTATVDPVSCVLVPQSGMFGEQDLPVRSPLTLKYLANFADDLRTRSSYLRYQKGHPYWSVWNVGPYTQAPYKVVWKEMPGRKFHAAYISDYDHPELGRKMIMPDHKVYFVSFQTEHEAAYLTGLLNAPVVSEALIAHLPALSAGTGVVENLNIPGYDPNNSQHVALSDLSKSITDHGNGPTPDELVCLNEIACQIYGITLDDVVTE